ncbi:MAG: right-handed parallel beta-helix repeat-containing protein, partial [Planctomycetota bacterium]
MNRGIAAAAVLGVLALGASTALAGTIKVPKDYATIQEAVDNAAAGDTIVVSKGTYRETVDVTGKNNLRFIGKKATWIGNEDGEQGAALTATGDGILVQGFIFRNGDGQVRITGNNAVVTKCTSYGGNYDDQQYSFVRVDGDGARVEKNKIRDASEPAIDINGDDAVASGNQFGFLRDMGIAIAGHDCVVEKNKFMSSNVMAINIEGNRARVVSNKITFARVMAIHVEGERVHIEKNSITYGGQACGISVGWEGTSGGSVINNKIKGVNGVGIRVEDDDDEDEGDLDADVSEDPVANDLISGNKIDFAAKDAIQCERNDSTISNNKIKYA